MKSYLKNKKYSFMIILFIVSFFFIGKVHAYSYKGYVYHTAIDSTLKEGVITNSTIITIPFDTPLNKQQGIDIYGFQFPRLLVSQYSNYANETQTLSSCNTWSISPAVQGQAQTMVCTNYGTTGSTSSGLEYTGFNGEFQFKITAFDSNGNGEPCFLDSNYQGTAICPMVTNNNIAKLEIHLAVFRTGATNSQFGYKINADKLVLKFNNDATEIVNALSNVTVQQINTTTAIQNFNSYVSDTSTTQAQTNQTTALGNINNTFTQHLSGMNELTQLVFLPINFIINVANNQCQPLIWDIPFVNTRVVVPCMSTIYNAYFRVIVSTLSTIFMGLLTYRCTIKLFNAFKGVLDAEDDKIEVIDL